MVRLRDIPRTAAFAWSSGPKAPLIVTGTKAGAVDADFSNETQLEIWDLALDNSGAVELQPAASIPVDSRFHDLAWSQPSEDYPKGIIAGALESGALDLWDVEKLLDGDDDSLIARVTKHSGAIKALQFNPFRPELLATAGAKGELYITDINNPENPFRLGTAARADDIEALDWNKKVPHILVTGSSGGFVTVWDVKAKKESLTLNNNGRKAVSAVAWDPDVPTRLMTAIPNDQDPLILVWDLRNSNAPERTLKGHDQGVLSLSWCLQDSNILLSCGKDNRTICWNPHTGQALGDFSVVTNWTFQTSFHPDNPNLFATASFDGKISVQTIQNTNGSTEQTTTTQALDGEDFFERAQSQPQGPSFSLPEAPKWFKRPVGASFGFGGKLVYFTADSSTNKSKISISTFSVDSSVGTATAEFEKALENGNLASICEAKIASAKTDEEKADWTVIETLISGNARKKLVEYLGFAEASEAADDDSKQANGRRDSKDEADFFDNAGEEGSFLSDLAATKGTRTNNPFQVYTGAESEADKEITRALLLGSFEKALDICLKENRLSDAFMIAICGGQKCIDKAQAAYFKKKSEGPNYLRLLASVVGKNLWDVVHNADLKDWKEVMAAICTFADQEEFPDLCEALGDRLEEAIGSSPENVSLRKDASFCYLAGSKLEKVVINWAEELQEHEKAGLIESESDTTSFAVHAKSLQDFIEKVTVFRQATSFKDSELQKTEDWKLGPLYAKYTEYADVAAAHGQLQVAEKYLDLLPTEYPAAAVARNRVKQATRKATPQRASTATPVTQRGQRIAPTYPGTTPAPAAAAPPPPQPTASSLYTPAQAQPAAAGFPGAQSAARSYTPAGNYTPAAAQQSSYGVSYQPPSQSYQAPGQAYQAPGQAYQAPSQAYQPPGQSYQPPGQSYQPPGQSYQPPSQASVVPPPPRNFANSPSITPAARISNLASWNDLPEDFGSKPQATSRRATPSLTSAITSPFPNQPVSTPPVNSPSYPQHKATPPPPPKGPPRISSPATAVPQPERTGSTASNLYAPPPQVSSYNPASSIAPPVARGASPYNPPPAAAPPSNRYAPAPSAQATQPIGGIAPPPRQAPPPNPYASPAYGQPPASFQPPPVQAPPPQSRPGPPPQGPPRTGPPPSGPPRAAPPLERPESANSQKAAAPLPPPPAAAPKYPRGDRSHISESSRPIFEVFTAHLKVVKDNTPPDYKPHVLDLEKRLNLLFDSLNENSLDPSVVSQLSTVAERLSLEQYPEATQVASNIATNVDQPWTSGVRRLAQMSKPAHQQQAKRQQHQNVA